MQRIDGPTLARVVIAVALLAVLAAFAGRAIVPTMSVASVVAAAFGGAMRVIVAVLAVALVAIVVRRFVLRHGGTDAQWSWFGGEPAGLVRLRAEARVIETTRQETT